MRKLLFNKWNIITFIFIFTLIAVYVISANMEFIKQYTLYSTADYYLMDSQNQTLSTSSFVIRDTDLTENTYTAPIYLMNTGDGSYLRIFITVSKQKDGQVYSLNNYNNTQSPYQINLSNDWTNGNIVTEEYDYDGELETQLGYYWRYYNKTVSAEKVEVFNSIQFVNGIEQDFEYIVNISIDIVEKTNFDANTMWPDRPTNWHSQVV